MLSCTAKHLSVDELFITVHELTELRDVAREKAMQRAMSSLSVENMQALIILAFDHVSNIISGLGDSQITFSTDGKWSVTKRLAYYWLSDSHCRIPPVERRV
jgi:hypothetical protein